MRDRLLPFSYTRTVSNWTNYPQKWQNIFFKMFTDRIILLWRCSFSIQINIFCHFKFNPINAEHEHSRFNQLYCRLNHCYWERNGRLNSKICNVISTHLKLWVVISMTNFSALKPFHHWSPFLCAECYGIQHIKAGSSGERVKCYIIYKTSRFYFPW